MIGFRAPGKLMLAGEHAVLAPGGEALALAVDLGVEVRARAQSSWELRREDSGQRWRPGEPIPEALRFSHAAWEECCAALGEPPPQLLVCGGYGGVGTGGQKPGVGSSAAATVAMAATLQALHGRALDAEGRQQLLALALRAHRRAQGGRGSGTDVATVILGGLVRWRPTDQRARKLLWPAGLHLLAGYSGRSVGTASLLTRLSAGAASEGWQRDLQGVAAPVAELLEAVEQGALAAILQGVRACHRGLARWDQRRQLGLVTPALSQLIGLAEAAGAAAKISGAGGGDSAIALADEREVLEEVARRWAAAGFLCFWPPPSPVGVRPLEEQPDASPR